MLVFDSNKWRPRTRKSKSAWEDSRLLRARRCAARMCRTLATTCMCLKCRGLRPSKASWKTTSCENSSTMLKTSTQKLWSVRRSAKWLLRARIRCRPLPSRNCRQRVQKVATRSTTRSSWFTSTSVKPKNWRMTKSNSLEDSKASSKKKSRLLKT